MPFKFNNSWLDVVDFDEMVRQAWIEAGACSGPNKCIVFKNKMKMLKQCIKEWSFLHNFEKNSKKKELIIDIAETEKSLEDGTASSDTKQMRWGLLKILTYIEKQKRTEANLKAKVKWGIEADENSKFLHGLINRKRRQLSIKGVRYEGVWVTSPTSVTFSLIFLLRNLKGLKVLILSGQVVGSNL